MSLLEAFSDNDDFLSKVAELTDNHSLTEAKNFFNLDNNFNLTSGSNKDNLLDSEYNDFVQNFKVIGPHIKNNNETYNFLNGIKKEKDGLRTENIESMELKLNQITDGIKKYQQEEKQVWLNLSSTKDPNFMEKRQIFLIRNKIEDLVNQRKHVFDDLEGKYKNISDKSNNVYKLKLRNVYLNDLQKDISGQNNERISNIDSDIMTRRRQIQINNYQYQKHSNFIFYLKIFFVFTLLALIPCLLAINNIPFANTYKKPFVTITIGALYLIAAIIIISRIMRVSNRSNFIWTEKKFMGTPNPKAGKRDCD
jgi:hypothetical protein